MLFSGDTLFRGAWGRVDLPTSSFENIISSITNKLINLPKDTIVYPGHRKINTYWRGKTYICRNEAKRVGIKLITRFPGYPPTIFDCDGG